MNNVKISVVTVCYNAVKELERTMLSVLNQTYDNVEYIVIDGGSTDGTVEIIKKYADRLAYWVSESDKGIYDAMNKGIKVATGEWINFMNAGDSFVDEEVLTKVFGQNDYKDIKCLYGNINAIRSGVINEEIALESYMIPHRMPCSHQAVFIKRDNDIYFDLKYKFASDYNVILNLYKKNGRAAFLHIPIIICNFDATDGITSKEPVSVFRECIRIRNDNKDLIWFWDLFKYFIKRYCLLMK